MDFTGKQDNDKCVMLYNLLTTEGLKLIQEVVTTVFTRKTGKSINSLTDEEKRKLKEVMPKKSHGFFESEEKLKTSLHASYGLHRIFLDEKHQPKSGWGNPVKETDIGIGDDVERLYRFYTTIDDKIPNPVDVSIESYTRLIDNIVEALKRLDPGSDNNRYIILTQAKNDKTVLTLM